ncbi:MAG: hypothetical protein ACI3VB_05210 [Oscillospiraceae bacterium]
MKHKIRFAAALMAAALICGASSVAAVLTGSAQEEAAAQEKNTACSYTVSEYDGDVGVYCDGELLYTTDINIAGLREADRKLLIKGIETGSYEDVLRLLEDLSS